MILDKIKNAFVNLMLACMSLLAVMAVYVTASSQTVIVQGPGPLKWTSTVRVGDRLSVTRILNPESPNCAISVRRSLVALENLGNIYQLPGVQRNTSLGRARLVRTYETTVPEMPSGEYIYFAIEEQTCAVLHFWKRVTVVEYENFLITVVPSQ